MFAFSLRPQTPNPHMIMKIRFVAALAPIVAVNARGVENPRAHDSKDYVSPSNDGIFIDTAGWKDIYEDGCDWLEANGYPGCPRYGSGDNGGIGVADDNCWWCVMD